MIRAILVFIFAAGCLAFMAAMPLSELGLLNPPINPEQNAAANVPKMTKAYLKFWGKDAGNAVNKLASLRSFVVSIPAILPATTFTKEVTVKPEKPKVQEPTAVEEVVLTEEVVTDGEGSPVAEVDTVEDVVAVEEPAQAPAETKTGFNTNFPFYSYSVFLAFAMTAAAIAYIVIGSMNREEKTVLPVKK